VRTLKTFQCTHILGASRGLLCDSSAVLFSIVLAKVAKTQLWYECVVAVGTPQQQSSLTWQPSAEVQSMTVTMSQCSGPSAGIDSTVNRQQTTAAKDDVELMSSDSSSSSSSDE